MCLILIAYHVNEQWPLVVLDNRDEFYRRPTGKLGPWPGAPDVIAGKDLQSGGSWMGVHRDGRWVAVTNFREPRRATRATKSRGWLVRDYLLGDWSAGTFLDQVESESLCYDGFNLLVGDRLGVWHVSNREPGRRQLSPGLYGLSNGGFDVPWPKVRKGKQALATLLENDHWEPRDAFELMADQACAPDAQLPSTGVPLQWERALSAMFIVTPTYGTRSTSLLAARRSGRVIVSERHYSDPPLQWQETRFDWPGFLDEKTQGP